MLNIWARFIYGPLLDDRVRTIADGVKPSRVRPPRGLPRAPGAEGSRARSRCRANSCSWTAPRSVSARVFLHLRGGAQFLPAVQRGDRGLLGRARWPRGRRAALDGGRALQAVQPRAKSARPLPLRPNCANPSAARQFKHSGDFPPWPTTAPSNTPPRPATTIRRTKHTYERFVHFTFVGILHVINLLFGLAVGGVMGHWFLALPVFLIAVIGAIAGLLSGSTHAELCRLRALLPDLRVTPGLSH